MECSYCQQQNPDDARFCNKCGGNLGECLDLTEDTCLTDSERKLVTVMFADLSGYTAMTERLDPEEVKGIMSQIFNKVSEIIKKYDGFIEKFIGDAVMAVFGVPKAHEDDPIRAIRAALEIRSAVEAFSPQFEQKIGSSLAMHTGINTGIVVTGEVNLEKGTHGLTGDAINLASRIQGLAKSGEIVAGESTYRLSRRYFNFAAMAPTLVSGKKEPLPVYKLVSVIDQQIITKRLKGVQAKLVGRESEMGQLMDAVETLKQGKGCIISIVGHAGTGKSRLVQEFKDRIKLDEIQWREGHAYAYTQNMAYYPLINLLTHAFQIREGDDTDLIKEKVETGVKELLWDKPEAKKHLGSLFSLSDPEVDEMGPESWREQLHRSVFQLLEALASRNPTVILFEDLHWADGSFIELLHLLLENTKRPVIFLCVYRPSFTLFSDSQPCPSNWSHQMIELRDMSWDQTQAMLISLLNSKTIPDDLRYFIKQKVEGNPFYLEEVINSLIETGILYLENDSWKLTKPLNLVNVPPTIQGVLTSRLDRLEKEAKRILQEASVIGRAFFYEVLNRVTGLTTPVDDCLLGLESLDLIRARKKKPDLEYIFKHALTQEVVYNGVLKRERLEIHERIGLVMEQLFKTRLTEFYETLAYHFVRGGSNIKAVDYLVKSGDKSLQRYALDESHNYFDQAYRIMGSFAEKTNAQNEILIDLLIKWAMVFYYRGDFDGLLRIFIPNQTIAEFISDKEKSGMFFAWLGWGFSQGYLPNSVSLAEQTTAFDKGLEYLIRARSIGEEIRSGKVIGYACTWLSWVYADSGQFKKGIENGIRASKYASSFPSDHYLYFKSLGGVAFCHMLMGQASHCIELGKKLIEYGHRYSQPRCLAMGYWWEGGGHYLAGDFEKAIEAINNSVNVSLDPLYKSLSLSYLIGYLTENNEMETAGKMLDELQSLLPKLSQRNMDIIGVALHGIVMIGKGKLSAGMEKIEKSLHDLRHEKSGSFSLMFEFMIAKIYLKIVEGNQSLKYLVLIRNIGFIMKHVLGAFRKAEAQFKKVIKMAEKMGAIGYVGRAHLHLGMLYKIKGHEKDAREHFGKAIPVLKETGAYLYAKNAEEELGRL